MSYRRLFLSIALCLTGLPGAVAASDTHVVCVQRQLTALGLDPGPADGINGTRTQDAVAAFVESLQDRSARALFEDLPDFSERAAVGWCREIGTYAPEVRTLMPSSEPPLILTTDDVSPEIRGYIARSYEDARLLFREEYGIETASKPVLAVAFDRDDLEELLLRPVPGIDDLSPEAARGTADEMCLGVERMRGSAYRNRIALCMPPDHQAAITSYEVWHSRYQYVMLHEYMHHVQREMIYDKVPESADEPRRMGPGWMVEGTAYLAEIKARAGSSREVSLPMISALRARDAEDPLTLASIRKKSTVRSDAEYAGSNLAVATLAQRYGEEQVIVFWREVGETDDWNEAFKRAFGMPIFEFEALFEELRDDQVKLLAFAGGKAPYELDKPMSRILGTARMGHGDRVRLN